MTCDHKWDGPWVSVSIMEQGMKYRTCSKCGLSRAMYDYLRKMFGPKRCKHCGGEL